MKTRYLVEPCTLHGKTFQRRWSRVYFGQDKADCQRWIKKLLPICHPAPWPSLRIDPRNTPCNSIGGVV